jgi:hypothetical protein
MRALVELGHALELLVDVCVARDGEVEAQLLREARGAAERVHPRAVLCGEVTRLQWKGEGYIG